MEHIIWIESSRKSIAQFLFDIIYQKSTRAKLGIDDVGLDSSPRFRLRHGHEYRGGRQAGPVSWTESAIKSGLGTRP